MKYQATKILQHILLCFLFVILFTTTAFATENIYDFENDPEAYKEYQKQQSNTVSTLSRGDYIHNERYEDYTVLKGIDVSKYQRNIDWKKVKADGYDFAIIRVGYRSYGSGELFEDSTYKENIEGAIAAGVDVGVYIFSQAITEEEAIEEAQYAISLASGYQMNLPIVMDFEYASTSSGEGGRLYKAKLSKEEATNVCNAFCNAAEAMGYTAMVYANRSMLNNSVNAADISNKYPIWLANYTSQTTYEGDYSYWQYTSQGSVDGISGNVDCNFRYIKKPVKPLTIEQTDCSYTDNTIRWSKVVEAYGYQLYRYDEVQDKYVKIATTVGTGNISHFDYDLTPGVAYKYKVRAFYKLYDKNWYGAYSDVLEAPTPTLSVTDLKATKSTTDTVTIKWTGNPEANGYAVYRSTDGNKFSLVKELTAESTSYKDTGLKSGKLYYYQVRSGVFASDASIIYAAEDSAAVTYATTKCKAPEALKASSYTEDAIKLSWDKVSGATSYKVYQYDTKSKKYKAIATLEGKTNTSYKVVGLSANKKYQFKVCAYTENIAGNTKGENSIVLNAATKAKAVQNINFSKNTTSQVQLTWNKTSGATGYQIYRATKKNGTYKKIATVTGASTKKYLNTKLKAGTTYYYKIRSYRTLDNKNYYGTFSEIVSTTTLPAKISKITYKSYKNKIKLSWKKVSKATGYIIYRYDTKTKKYKKLATTKKLTYTNSRLAKNTNYTYKIVAYKTLNGKTYTGEATTLRVRTKK